MPQPFPHTAKVCTLLRTNDMLIRGRKFTVFSRQGETIAMNPIIAKNMAYVLNKRGFITHDDFPFCNDNDFGSHVREHEYLLRQEGYAGGVLESWSTSFRMALFTYGVLDSDNHTDEDRLDAYTLATGLELEQSGLLVCDLKPLLIGLQYLCSCGHKTNIDPDTIPYTQKLVGIHLIRAWCGSCKSDLTSPNCTYPLFKDFP